MSTIMRSSFPFWLAVAAALQAQDLPKGQIIDEVKCQADASQTYALYLPSGYSPDHKWSVILAFDARGRGRTPVAQFQAAAEKYGYIVAGSNNSRNGPGQVSQKAAEALIQEMQMRFSVDPKRFYAAGQSGGARFAMDLAQHGKVFAGVIASSAGFAHPPSEEVSVPFVVFGTAGTEDFNYLEMRKLDRLLTSPHRIRIFNGDHTWLPSDLAVEALGWMELQAMRSSLRPRDEGLIDSEFAIRKAQLAATKDLGEIYLENAALATDFKGLRDVSAYEATAASLEKQKDVLDALHATRTAEMDEGLMNDEIRSFIDQLGNPAERADSLAALRERLTKLSTQAKAPEDSPQRRMARRVLHGVMADNGGRNDPDFQKLLDEVKL